MKKGILDGKAGICSWIIMHRRIVRSQIDALSASHSIHIAQTTDCETIDQMVEYMLDSVSGQVIVIGLSMGGYV